MEPEGLKSLCTALEVSADVRRRRMATEMNAQQPFRGYECFRGGIVFSVRHVVYVCNVPKLGHYEPVPCRESGELNDATRRPSTTDLRLESITHVVSNDFGIFERNVITDEVVKPIVHSLVADSRTTDVAEQRLVSGPTEDLGSLVLGFGSDVALTI